MKEVFIAGDNIITSLGFSTSGNMQHLEKEVIGIRPVDDDTLFPSTIPLSLVDTIRLEEEFRYVLQFYGKTFDHEAYTRLEKLFIISIYEALQHLPVIHLNAKTLLVISTTKGNIDLLEAKNKTRFPHLRLYLWEMARVIRDFFGFVHPPLVISNACVSGIMAIMTATRYLRSGLYDYAVVSGGDILSEFVISGFQSFQSLSPAPCRPYDAARDGLSLGEGCGTMVLTTDASLHPGCTVKITGASTSNDANHISGPSRTGYELCLAMQNTLAEAGVSPRDIDFINAHGTATPFNDEMESKALALAGLLDSPVNSFKGYIGHTLGAAGLIESIVSVHSLRENLLIRSAGFETRGVPEPIKVIKRTENKEIQTCLKTASGFGGCNAAILFQKEKP
ncbi:MAG: beta-ketoacyl synthase N-terminal-like domain-containing protein [bacterium]